jgi:hypothetical protein
MARQIAVISRRLLLMRFGEARARAGLGLHQSRDAEALRAAHHAQAGAGRGRRGVRCDHRGSGHDPQSREADRHACVHGGGAQRHGPALDRGHDRPRGRRQERARPHHHPAGCARSHRADRIAAILDHRLGRAGEPRDQLSHGVHRGAEQPAPGRLHYAPAHARCPRCGR